MLNNKIEEKESFRVVGYKKRLTGENSIHSVAFSTQKTNFFTEMIQNGKMKQLQALSESPYGFGAIVNNGEFTTYYPSVKTSQSMIEGTEEVIFPKGDYLILAKSGGLSRLAFDDLENEAFHTLLPDQQAFQYTGDPIAEILLNGNPADCEVELWIPIKHLK